MNSRLASLGYELGPSKYSPALGYTGLSVLISGHPTERFFDVKTLHIPTYRWPLLPPNPDIPP